MCGIFVAFKTKKSNQNNWGDYAASLQKVQHRGPDNMGLQYDDLCYMGHTRLSIIDLDAGSNQPFEYKSLIMVYNGEVFNYKELRAELELFGLEFRTESDTEVVLQAYAYWGRKCFEKFNGMWALAIYDKDARKLIVSRDRFSQKPLFSSKINDIFYFASEPQQIADIVGTEQDFITIKNFLEEGDSVKNGKTFFKKIKEYPSACYSEISHDGVIETFKYWSYPQGRAIKTTDQDISHFEDLLIDSVKLRLRSDVPVAVCLSGGVDSTIIADIIHEVLPREATITSYTYKAIDNFDESPYACEIARRLNCEIKVIEQPLSADEYISRLKSLVTRMGRGNSSPAIISNDCIHSEISREGYKVSIDGQGADELLAGYKTFYISHIVELIRACEFKQCFKTIHAMLSQHKQFKYGVLTILLMYIRLNSPIFVRKFMRKIYGYQKFFSNYKEQESEQRVDFPYIDVVQQWGLNAHLVSQHSNGLRNLVYYGDMVAMNNSVENRSPFLDHRLVDFVFSRDSRLKVFNGVEKYALRKMNRYKKYVDILNRDKVGFESSIRKETKLKMQAELINSKILTWPIFAPNINEFIRSKDFISEKYERFAFRLFQVHLWSQEFTNLNKNEANK
jgi:asparagine synthase (glutamine-hydrolysing)